MSAGSELHVFVRSLGSFIGTRLDESVYHPLVIFAPICLLIVCLPKAQHDSCCAPRIILGSSFWLVWKYAHASKLNMHASDRMVGRYMPANADAQGPALAWREFSCSVCRSVHPREMMS